MISNWIDKYLDGFMITLSWFLILFMVGVNIALSLMVFSQGKVDVPLFSVLVAPGVGGLISGTFIYVVAPLINRFFFLSRVSAQDITTEIEIWSSNEDGDLSHNPNSFDAPAGTDQVTSIDGKNRDSFGATNRPEV